MRKNILVPNSVAVCRGQRAEGTGKKGKKRRKYRKHSSTGLGTMQGSS